MATEDIRITQPVAIKTDSEARVAYDFMRDIAFLEAKEGSGKGEKPRDYYLKLYLQCRRAVRGEGSLQDILELK